MALPGPDVHVVVDHVGFNVTIDGESKRFENITQENLYKEYEKYAQEQLSAKLTEQSKSKADHALFQKNLCISAEDKKNIQPFYFYVYWDVPELDLHMGKKETDKITGAEQITMEAIEDFNLRLTDFTTFARETLTDHEQKFKDYFNLGFKIAVEELLLAISQFREIPRSPEVTNSFWKTTSQVLPYLEKCDRARKSGLKKGADWDNGNFDKLYKEIKDEFNKHLNQCIKVDSTPQIQPKPQPLQQLLQPSSSRHARKQLPPARRRGVPSVQPIAGTSVSPVSVNGDTKRPLLRGRREDLSYGTLKRRDDTPVGKVIAILQEAKEKKWDTDHTISGTLFSMFCIKSPPTAIAELRALYFNEVNNNPDGINKGNVGHLAAEIKRIMQGANGRRTLTRCEDTQNFYGHINAELDFDLQDSADLTP